MKIQGSLPRVDLDDFILDEDPPSVLGHLLYVETGILGTVDSGEQAWSHAGVVVVRRRADQSDAVAALNIPGKVQKNRQMGMPAPDENKMLSHGSPAPDTSFLLRHSSEEEEIKKRFLGIEDREFPAVSQKGNAV